MKHTEESKRKIGAAIRAANQAKKAALEARRRLADNEFNGRTPSAGPSTQEEPTEGVGLQSKRQIAARKGGVAKGALASRIRRLDTELRIERVQYATLREQTEKDVAQARATIVGLRESLGRLMAEHEKCSKFKANHSKAVTLLRRVLAATLIGKINGCERGPYADVTMDEFISILESVEP